MRIVNNAESCDLSIFMTSVLSVTVHFDELCIVAWDADYRHENMVGGSCAQALCTLLALINFSPV